jgi:hypothetical protein
MGAHMKTTIEISDPLFEQAKRLAAREKLTLRTLVEQGLSRVLAESDSPSRFQLRNASFRGEGLQPEVDFDNWKQIRQMAYGERGG